MAKVKVATAWLGGCAGCHMAFLDLDEKLLDILPHLEFTSSPLTDIKEIPEVDLAIVEGAVVNEENLEVLKHIREKAKVLVAIGDCAVFGGIPSMRNFFKLDEVYRRSYVESESTVNPSGEIPHGEVPELLDLVRPLNYYVKVDAYIPGCPPYADQIEYALRELIEGRIPVVPADIMDYE